MILYHTARVLRAALLGALLFTMVVLYSHVEFYGLLTWDSVSILAILTLLAALSTSSDIWVCSLRNKLIVAGTDPY